MSTVRVNPEDFYIISKVEVDMLAATTKANFHYALESIRMKKEKFLRRVRDETFSEGEGKYYLTLTCGHIKAVYDLSYSGNYTCEECKKAIEANSK